MQEKEPKIHTLAVGMPKELHYGEGKTLTTGIHKTETREVYLSFEGFERDDVADKKNHGGVDRAVCLYPIEHYQKWELELGKVLPLAAFGENLTVENMLEADVCIGDIYKVGDAVIQITQGRVPCSTIDKHVNANTLLKRVIETGFTGYLGRVLEEGMVRSNSPIQLLEKHPAALSILFCNETYFNNVDPVAMEKIQSVDELALDWKEKLNKRIRRLTN